MKSCAILFFLQISLIIELTLENQNKNTNRLLDDFMIKDNFQKFKIKFSKEYSKSEETNRLKNYKENYLKAKDLNEKVKNSKFKDQAIFGETQFSDLSELEFQSKYLTLKVDSIKNKSIKPNLENFQKRYLTSKKRVTSSAYFKPQASFTQLSTVYGTFDWRDYQAVGAVGNQNQCGSCWAFAGIGVIECQYYLYNGQWLEFSKQQLVDCDNVNKGCTGGTIQKGLDYIIDNGVMTENSYTYLGYKYYCLYNPKQALKLVSFYDTFIIESKIDFLQYVIQSYGPVAGAMNANVLKFYQGGILDVDTLDCDPNLLNHGILIVGFGVDLNGEDYFIVKNSWGAAWGEKGFFRIASRDWRNYNNPYGICGINSFIITVKLG